jgi:hypothetical protein
VAAAATALEGAARTAAKVLWPLALLGYLVQQHRDPENIRAQHEIWEWDGLPIGHALKTAFHGQRPLLAVDAAGALPFWSELPALDMLGLNDRHIALNPPPGFGTGPIGHELGDGDYVLRRAPDLIAFANAAGRREPCCPGGRQMLRDRRFHEGYRPVRLQQDGVVGYLSFKLEGGPLGLRRTATETVLPGWFFSGEGPARAFVAGQTLVTRLHPDEPGLMRLPVDAGSWKVVLPPGATAAFACGGVSARAQSGPPGTIYLSRPSEVQIVVGTSAATLDLSEVALVRAAGKEAAWSCDFAPDTPATMALADLAHRRTEGSFWAAPGNLLLGRGGLHVELPGMIKPRRLELSVDNNDRYAIVLFRRGQLVARQEFGPMPNRGGLAVVTLDLPQAASSEGIDGIDLVPISGDDCYSLGHLVFAP